MAETESYVTKKNPTAEDWLDYNQDYFASLRGETPEGTPRYAPFVDVDVVASKSGLSVDEYFEHIREKVGSLGQATLRLVYTYMDESWHVTVVPKRKDQDNQMEPKQDHTSIKDLILNL